MGSFLATHPRYQRAKAIIPAPSSKTWKKKTLPSTIGATLAKRLGKRLVIPVRLQDIPSQKDYDEDEGGVSRGDLQHETIRINEKLPGDVIVLDDLYESSGTLGELGRAARAAGASSVLGLAVTKTAKYTQGMDLKSWPWG